MDAIVYILCDQYVWFVRRLYREERPSADSDTLSHMVDLATCWTDPDACRLCLAADLTSTVHLADIMEVTFDVKLRKRIRFREVKEGAHNDRLGKMLDMETDGATDFGLTAMDLKDAKQLARMLRQRQRLQGLNDIIRERQGIDPRSGNPLLRTADGPDYAGYQGHVRGAIAAAHGCGEQIVRLDGCLIVTAVRTGYADTSLAWSQHVLFHFRNKSAVCLLGTEREDEELAALRLEPQVFDFVEYHLAAKWDSPVFAWGSLDRVCDLIFGRIRVFAQFDVAQFAELAQAYGVTVKRITKKSAKVLGLNGRQAAQWWAASAELPNGTSIDLISGDFQRIFLELARPKNIIRGWLVYADEVRRLKKGDDPRTMTEPLGRSATTGKAEKAGTSASTQE
jgi:hypothetical protein